MTVEVDFPFIIQRGQVILSRENRGLELSTVYGGTLTAEAEAWCSENDVRVVSIRMVGNAVKRETDIVMAFETEEGAAKYMMMFC